jgi:hypothetical protein
MNFYFEKLLSNPPKSPFFKGGLEYAFFPPFGKGGQGGFFIAGGEAKWPHRHFKPDDNYVSSLSKL